MPAFVSENGFGKIMEAPGLYICASLLGFCVNFLTLGVIKSTSGLTFKVLGQAKNTAVILISVLVFGSQITGLQIIGYTISMVGFYVPNGEDGAAKAMESMNIEMKNSSVKAVANDKNSGKFGNFAWSSFFMVVLRVCRINF